MEMEFGKLESFFLLILGSTDYKTGEGKYDIEKLSQMFLKRQSSSQSQIK